MAFLAISVPFMRRVYTVLMAIGLAVLCGCQKKSEPPASPPPKPAEPKVELLFRHHFIGARQLTALTNAARLRAVGELPESQKLLERALQKLSAAPFQFLQPALASNAVDGAALIRPLLDDLWRSESVSAVKKRGIAPTEWSLRVRLDEERSALWETNLIQLAQAWQLGSATNTNTNGLIRWEIGLTGSICKFQIVRDFGVMLIGVARGSLPEEASLLKRLKSSSQTESSTEWLEVEANTAWLAENFALPAWLQGPPAQWPRTELRLANREGRVRSQARLLYLEPLALPLPPWQIPTNTIHDPLVSFTAARGLSRWLGKFEAISQLQLPPLADQIAVWAESEIPFLTFAAMPAPEATNLVTQVAQNLPALVGSNQTQRVVGEFLFETNRAELRWRAVPPVSPWLRPLDEPAGRFVMAGLFPYAPSRRPAPAELLAQVLGRTNLIYFDWEITQGRLQQWRQIGQLPTLLTYELLPNGRRRQRGGRLAVPGDNWLEYIGSHQKIGYTMRHGITPNGGGKLVNQYTLIMDVLVDTNGAPAASMLQVHSPANHQEGDLFWQDDNFGDGRADGFKGAGTFTAGAWHRVALAVDLAAKPPVATKFVDGIKQDDWPQKRIDHPNRALRDFAILFGSGDQDDYRAWYVNSVQIRSGKMTDAELTALGGPQAKGIPHSDAGVTGQWDFDQGDLRATTGRPLEFFDGTNGVCATKTKFGSTTQFGLPDIAGEPAQIMVVPGDHLGNAATEITQTAPNEIQFRRNSDLGFTAFELVALLSWLENPAWPLFGRQLGAPANSTPAKTAAAN
ncbi:MAG: hypothetical protein HY043_02620 [Verrucomicrobia bacterium]|nr:hypothetical protein [Verrucomicrobiota bacterium]